MGVERASENKKLNMEENIGGSLEPKDIGMRPGPRGPRAAKAAGKHENSTTTTEDEKTGANFRDPFCWGKARSHQKRTHRASRRPMETVPGMGEPLSQRTILVYFGREAITQKTTLNGIPCEGVIISRRRMQRERRPTPTM